MDEYTKKKKEAESCKAKAKVTHPPLSFLLVPVAHATKPQLSISAQRYSGFLSKHTDDTSSRQVPN